MAMSSKEQKNYAFPLFSGYRLGEIDSFDALMSWYEDLLDAIQHDCPKFGNDIDKVDQLVAELVATADSVVTRFENPRGGHWQMGLYSVEDHVKMGMNNGALPDGKLCGEAMASAIFPVQGGGEIQFNVIDRKTLLDAQQNPKNLVVRVSGFSAYFTSLVKETQDEIIKRREHAGV